MKVKDLLSLLRTDYVELSNSNDKYAIEYTKKGNIPQNIMEAQIVDIIPITGLRKQLFDASAPEGDYVAALKLVYNDDVVLEAEEVNSSQDYTYKEEEPQNKRPNFNIPPFGSSIFGGSDLFDKLMTPELLEQLTGSEFFQNMMSPENLTEILNSDEFKDFMKNVDLSQLGAGGFNPFGGFPQNGSNYDNEDDDDDEYEEI